jgi:hypothetical protein
MLDRVFDAYRNDGDFTKFAAATRGLWAHHARVILSRWRSPANVTEDDLVQEMLLACWLAVHGCKVVPTDGDDPLTGYHIAPWSPERGPSLRTYVTFHAIDKARKFLHKKRRAGHLGGAGPSRFEMPFSAFAREGDEDFDPDRFVPAVPASQEHELARTRVLAGAGEFRAIIEVFERTSSLDAAAEFALEKQAFCEKMLVNRFPEARDSVRRMIETLSDQEQVST